MNEEQFLCALAVMNMSYSGVRAFNTFDDKVRHYVDLGVSNVCVNPWSHQLDGRGTFRGVFMWLCEQKARYVATRVCL